MVVVVVVVVVVIMNVIVVLVVIVVWGGPPFISSDVLSLPLPLFFFRHKLLSYQFGFLCLCFLFAAMRFILFLFLCAFKYSFAYDVMYWFVFFLFSSSPFLPLPPSPSKSFHLTFFYFCQHCFLNIFPPLPQGPILYTICDFFASCFVFPVHFGPKPPPNGVKLQIKQQIASFCIFGGQFVVFNLRCRLVKMKDFFFLLIIFLE